MDNLNYTYPEFVNLRGASPAAIKSAITDQINRLYGPTEDDFSDATNLMSAQPEPAPQNLMRAGAAQAVRTVSQAVEGVQSASHGARAVEPSSGQANLAQSHPQQHAESQPQTHAQRNPSSQTHAYGQSEEGYHAEGQSHHHQHEGYGASLPHERIDWTVRVRTKLHQFGQSFTILIFVGDPPASEHDWRTSPHFVGAFAPFVNESPEECENCREHAQVIVEGFVNISKHLHRLHRGGHLSHLQPDEVVHYLKQKIHWRIETVRGRGSGPTLADSSPLLRSTAGLSRLPK
jgi:hypothetical protein